MQTLPAHFFSDASVDLPTPVDHDIRHFIQICERLMATPAWQAQTQTLLPAALLDAQAHNPGVLLSYDFHCADHASHARLIEINSNAGGALLNALHQGSPEPTVFLQMFLQDWQAAGKTGQPGHIAIVDTEPTQQFLHEEFQAFARLFESAGIRASICAPEQLRWQQGLLCNEQGQRIDMVYNRLTDFLLQAPCHESLRSAWLTQAIVLSPHPLQYVSHADKHNLLWLQKTRRQETSLQKRPNAHDDLSLTPAEQQLFQHMLPDCLAVYQHNADALWQQRKEWFFKPFQGYGAKAVYRGDKLTRNTWQQIISDNGYLAQALSPPGTVQHDINGVSTLFKADLRYYVYNGQVLSRAARLYQGQTTNFRTPGGGFARIIDN